MVQMIAVRALKILDPLLGAHINRTPQVLVKRAVG